MPIRRLLAAPIAGVALFAVPAVSQSVRDTVRLDDVVVTATRMEHSRRDVPASITVVTGEELRARGIRFVLDWLREAPGATVVQNGSFGSVTSLFLRGGESDYTRVLLDGVPINTPGGSINLAHLSTDNVERIELLRGPASVLYGSDAVAGVLHVITRRGRGEGRLSGSLRAGSLGTSDVRLGYDGANGRTDWSMALSRYETDGTYGFNNRYRSIEGSGRLAHRPDPRTDLALTARWGEHRAHFPTDFDGAARDSNQFTTDGSLALSLDAGRELHSRLAIRLLAALFDGDGAFEDRSDGPHDMAGFAFAGSRQSRLARRIADVRLLARPAQRVHLTTGLEYSTEAERQASTTTSDFGDGPFTESDTFDRRRRNTAGYGQAVWKAGEALDVQGGVRLDWNQVFGTFATWRGGVVVRPVGALRLHGAMGTAFKAPTFSEQFADSPFERGDPGLRPERTVSWEAGVEGTLAAGRLTGSATWFDQRFRDLIQYTSSSPDEPTYVNVGRARSHGLELGTVWSALEQVSLHLTWTVLRTRVEDAGGSTGPGFSPGERLLRRPGSTINAGVRWRPTEGAHVGADVARVGARDDVDFRVFPAERVTLPGYTVVNLSTDLPARGPLVATLAVRNLFDERFDSVVGFPGIGRVVLVGVRTK